jgi:general secretion pathway protein I
MIMLCNKTQPKATRHQHGFTLIEVMVAVAIVALAVSALLFSVGKQVESSDYLREKILAQWLALNILQQAQLTARVTEKFTDDQDSGDSKFANRDWRWEIQTTKTDDEDFARIDVKIYSADNDTDSDPIANTTGYLDNYYKLNKISNRTDSFIGDETSDESNTSNDNQDIINDPASNDDEINDEGAE